MSAVRVFCCLCILLVGVLYPLVLSAEKVRLNVPVFSDNSHLYYHELLQKSLLDIGFEIHLVLSEIHLPQKRLVKMVEDDQMSLCWLIRTEERDKRFTPVAVGLTNNLIGTRVLLIPKGDQYRYDDVRNINDFRKMNLKGALGADWYDIRVWEANGLKYVVFDGEWRRVFRILSRKQDHIHYFSRGINEVMAEIEIYPNLEIEHKLVFVYDADFIFYLSKSASTHKDKIEFALNQSAMTGLMDQLIQKYWGGVFDSLDFGNRIHIKLVNP